MYSQSRFGAKISKIKKNNNKKSNEKFQFVQLKNKSLLHGQIFVMWFHCDAGFLYISVLEFAKFFLRRWMNLSIFTVTMIFAISMLALVQI